MNVIRLTKKNKPVELLLTGTLESGNFEISGIQASTTNGTSEITLSLETNVAVPLSVLEESDSARDDEYRLKTAREANDAGSAGQLAKLRRELAAMPINFKGETFFDLPGGSDGWVGGHVSIRLPLEGQGAGKFLLKAKARTEIQTKIELSNYPNGTIKGWLAVVVCLDEDDVKATLETILPDKPDLGFSLREMKLPSLSFAGASLDPAAYSVLNIPLPDWLTDMFEVSGGKPFKLNVDGATFILTAYSPVVVKVNSGEVIKIDGFKVTNTNGDFKVEGQVSAKQNIPINQTFNFGGEGFPVRGAVGVGTASFELDATKAKITWNVKRFSIEAVDDPESRISVAFDFSSETTFSGGKPTWKLADLEVLDGVDDIRGHAIDFIDGRIRIRIDALTKEAEEFLRRLLRLLAALVRYLGKAMGPIPGLLSDLAEALAELLVTGLQQLFELLKSKKDHVTLELRLDAATLRPVQLIVTLRKKSTEGDESKKLGGSLLGVDIDLKSAPALVIDFEHNWQGFALLYEPDELPAFTVSTNLWLESSTGKTSAIPELKEEKEKEPLVALTATMKDDRNIVVAALQHGRAKFFQTFGDKDEKRKKAEGIDETQVKISTVGKLTDLKDLGEHDVSIQFQADRLKGKLLGLMPQGPADGSMLEELAQSVKVRKEENDEPEYELPEVKTTLKLAICFADLEIPFDLALSLNVFTFHFQMEASDEIVVVGKRVSKPFMGFHLDIQPAKGAKKNEDETGKLLKLAFTDSDMRLSLAEGAEATLRYDRLSSDGGGLELRATRFDIGRGGLDLDATITDRPVRLGGLDQPFRFKHGSIIIRGGQLLGGTISGYGPMPPALIGEANAEIDLVFGQRTGRLALVAANAKLEKEGEPLYSTGTRFRTTIDALGLAFREPEVGPVQFYFQLWGAAAFEPGAGEFNRGLLKNLRAVSIRLDGAPLTGDGRELAKHISFLVELEPPISESLFDIFGFEIRGIAFYPASRAWPDNPPTIGVAGQVSFLEAGDVVSSEINFHELLIAAPEPGGTLPLPRIRADGLSVLLRVGGIAQIEATAVAVDGSIPSLYKPIKLPADVSADGFLAAGRVDIVGLGAFGGAMGFLELRKAGIQGVKHAMFLYGQAEKLTERIDTPIGPLFVREVGYGFGKNYTLTAIAEADGAKSPREMVKKLDEVSKLQGNLMNFNAWTPQYETDAVTLALRGMISMAATSTSSSAYDEKGESKVSNPFLMDVVLAIRSDLTFFANVRAWIAHNYNDWYSSSMGAQFKERPTLRGYLYFSVPRKELLARFLSDPKGIVGKHPELPKELVQAIEATRFSATVYIRPGLYHAELGWPYELGFELGERNGNFHLDLSGGLVLRIEDATMLYGVAFKAAGHMQFGGQVGNANFGASAIARADFLLGARFIAYIAPLDPRDTLFYGEIFLNLTLRVGVSIWMSFKIFRKRFTIRIGFSIMLTISVAAEVVLSGRGIGARVHAAVGVRGFGRTLSVGIGFSFGDNQLSRARARVARFMDLGLGIDPPREDLLHAPAPAPEVERKKRAADADERLNDVVPQLPPEPPADPDPDKLIPGREIDASNFWALLFLAESDDTNPTYLMVLVPKDDSDDADNTALSTFFAEPFNVKKLETEDKPKITHDRDCNADYKLTGLKKAIKHLRWDGEVVTLDPGSVYNLVAGLEKEFRTSEFGPLDLNALMAECFLDAPEGGAPNFGEPYQIHHNEPLRKPQQTARDERVRQASRNINQERNIEQAKLEASLVAEEKRSALINKIGESAFEMAAEWRAQGGVPDAETWANEQDNDQDDLTAPDFGLSFLVEKEDLVNLFNDDRSAKFKLCKRVLTKHKDWEFVGGGVTLLNHPDDAFSVAEPRLDAARVEAHEDGFRLYWDLEPAFGSSDEMPFEKDPESLLAFYSIERSFEGTVTGWIAEFQTRTATPLEYQLSDETVTTSRARAQMHLCDDFSRGGVPDDLRAFLVGKPIPSGRSARDVWSEFFGATPSVDVVYKVTAVDIMGTSTGQRVLENRLVRPQQRIVGPLSAELAIEYQHKLASLGEKVDRPDIRFALLYPDKPASAVSGKKEQPAGESAVFQLRVRAHHLKGGGQYGADAVDDSRNRPSQADIDTFRGDLDHDLFLAPVNSGGVELAFLIGQNQIELKTFGIYPTLDDALKANEQDRNEALKKLAEALRIPGGESRPDDLRACRVFLRQLRDKHTENDSVDSTDNASPWLIAQTQLVVTECEECGQPFTATVELLETPLKLPFMALDQRQIEREAGRLELVYPGVDATFADLTGSNGSKAQSTNATLRRLDPDRRSAIRLDFNVSGAETERASGNKGDDFKGASLNGLIAGFDIFVTDPARLRMRSDEPDGLTPDVVAQVSRKRATVKVLPRSLSGLFPDALPNFRSIDVRYPSDTLRTDPQRRKGRTRARWYSGAESLVAFPTQRLRRSLFPAPEEAMLSALLDEFVAEEVTIALFAPDVPEAARRGEWEDLSWEAVNQSVLGTELALDKDMESPFRLLACVDEEERPFTKAPPIDNQSCGIKAHELRALLRGLVLEVNTVDDEYTQWRRNGSPEALATAFRVKVIVTAKGADKSERSESVEVNLASPIHPVLADTLDALCYENYGKEAGEVYRAYEVVREPVPPTDSKGFDAFLDGHGPAADPYGWSALRALGLAAGFRLYHIDEARYLSGKELFCHVNRVFSWAIRRYCATSSSQKSGLIDPLVDLGHPFVELVDLPESFMAISSTDGRAPGAASDTARIIKGDTSILQIGLRPRAGQQLAEGSVRYLAVKVDGPSQTTNSTSGQDATTPAEKDDGTAVELNLVTGAVYDFVGLPLADGDMASRFADKATVAALFPEDVGIDEKPVAALDRFSGLAPNETCFVLRVTQVEDATCFFDEAKKSLEKDLKKFGFKVTGWFEHPGETALPVFETFDALDPPLLAALMGHREDSDRATSLDTLLSWLPPDHLPVADLTLSDKCSIDPVRIADLAPVAARVAEWTARFLTYGAEQTAKDSATELPIRFALAALTSEESFPRVPDANGRVSAFFIDPSRVGREHYFAIRPYGRYAGIETIIGPDSERPVTLKGGLSNDWRRHFAAVSLDRSKPLEPPAILAARPGQHADEERPGTIELIVARTPDQIASEANLIAERALQGGWTGLEFRATYARTDHAARIWGSGFDPFSGFDESNFGGTSQTGDVKSEILTRDQLKNLRSVAPDAWRGAIRYELSGLPHFFDTMALVHQSAGVVVSDVAALPLPRASTITRFPPFDRKDAVTDVRKAKDWGIAEPEAQWHFGYEVEDDTVVAEVRFDLPMMRNLDLMTEQDLRAWTDGKADRVAPVYRLPNPEASYRVSTVSTDFSASTPQIEILPVKNASDGNGLYLARLAGDRFGGIQSTPEVCEQPSSDKWNWRLRLSVKLSDDEAAGSSDMPEIHIEGEGEFTGKPADPFDPVAWAGWAPDRSLTFVVGTDEIDQSVLDDIATKLDLFSDAPGVRAVLDALADSNLGKGDRIAGRLPLGQAVPDLSELQPVKEKTGKFVWPEKADGLDGLTHAEYKAHVAAAVHLTGNNPTTVKTLLGELKSRWSNLRQTGKGGTQARYEPIREKQENAELAPPFAQFEMIRFSKTTDPLESADIAALIDAVQDKVNDRYVAAQAVKILDALGLPADDVAIPIPVGTSLQVDGLENQQTGQISAGFHWVPDDGEMEKMVKNLAEENPLRKLFFRLRREAIFGPDARPQLTGYSGSSEASSTPIYQKGEAS